MSNQSNKLGRAYEYACLISLFNAIDKIRQVKIIENSSFTAALKSWELLTIEEQEQYLISANAIINTIFEFEPLIQEKNNNDILELQLQQDNKGETADVRDILIIRSSIGWEIGLSVKHNHFAAKHSRLSKNIDFGEKWLNIPVSQNYKNEIHPIFTYLEQEKQKGTNWRDLTDKEDKIYYPLMLAFKNELNRIYQQHGAIVVRKMVEYFLGKYDFYKIISVDNKQKTQLQVFNLHQQLGKNRVQKLKSIPLPTEILYLDFQKNKKNTLLLCLDEGWQFSLRIHNAKTAVEPSLKFDIQIKGIPADILIVDCFWNK